MSAIASAAMSRLSVRSFSVSLDGFAAGPRQDLEHPLGVRGMELHEWLFATRTFHQMVGKDGGATGVDDDFAARGFAGVGAWILGRNMFGPVRGPWPDDAWKGWWGATPPYHVPVFVLTHHERASIAMDGGTTFHFVTGGFDAALEQARAAAAGRDILISGGASTIRQAFAAGVIDEVTLDIGPALLGSGERLFDGVEDPPFEQVDVTHSPSATHIRYRVVR